MFAHVLEWLVMHTISASQDAVYLHTYNGDRPETYADTPAGACALAAAEVEQLFVLLVPMPIAVSVLLDSVLHNLLVVLQTAVLFAIIAQAVILAAVMAATSTAVAAYHTCTSCVTQEIQDHAMCINLLLLLLEFSPLTVATLHQWLKKIQNIHNGQELAYISTCTPYTV